MLVHWGLRKPTEKLQVQMKIKRENREQRKRVWRSVILGRQHLCLTESRAGNVKMDGVGIKRGKILEKSWSLY